MIHTLDIIGSCVSRDVFNRIFIQNYAEYFKVNTYIPRVPIPVVISKRCDYDLINLKKDCDTPWRYECFFKMSERNSLDALINNESEILLLDFYTDAQYGVAITDDGNCTVNNGFVRRLKSLNSKVVDFYNYQSKSEEYFQIWKRSFDYFIHFCRNHTSYKKILINGIKGTNIIRHKDKYSKNIADEEVNAINELWRRMDEYAQKKWNIPVLSFEREFYLDPEYPFGGVQNEIVHFEVGFYQALFTKMKELIREDNVGLQRREDATSINLVKNNSFTTGFLFWEYTNAIFSVTKKDKLNWLTPVCQLENAQSDYVWIWSNPIEINANGETVYTLSFEYVINDEKSLQTDTLFGIRIFKNACESSVSEAIKTHALKKDPSHQEIGKKYKYTFHFTPNGKYIRVAPHCNMKASNISFTNICLRKGKSDAYCPWVDKGIDFSSFRKILECCDKI